MPSCQTHPNIRLLVVYPQEMVIYRWFSNDLPIKKTKKIILWMSDSSWWNPNCSGSTSPRWGFRTWRYHRCRAISSRWTRWSMLHGGEWPTRTTSPWWSISIKKQGLVNVPWLRGFVSHHSNKYLLEIISPIFGWCETVGHLPTHVVKWGHNEIYHL